MSRVLGGAVLIIAGIAAFIEASGRAPDYSCRRSGEGFCPLETGSPKVLVTGHLARTPYDLLRIGAWALVIIGGLLVVTGLIRYFAAQTRRSQ
jgi:hypothetical protein